MTIISKQLFDATCSHESCYNLLHPWGESCWLSSIATYRHSFIGSTKFYTFVYLAQILMRGKKMLNHKEWVKMGEYYARSTFLGGMISGTCISFGCLFRWMLGNRFNYYTYFFLPNVVNGVFIYLEPPSRRGLVINLFANMFIEYWLRILERGGYLVVTKSKQTLLFMMGSALLFYLMRLEGDKKERTPLFWFFTPEKVRRKSDDSKNVCPHEGKCWKYILKGCSIYFGAGAAFTLSRVLMPKIKTPLSALATVRWKHFKMGLFLSSYIGIYRAVICYLCQKRGFDSASYALPAGYLAGLSLMFNPNLGLAIGSLTAAFKLYSTILYEKKVLPANIPLPELFYCITQGTLFSAGLLQADVCPNYIIRLLRSVSNGCYDLIHANLLEAVKKAA